MRMWMVDPRIMCRQHLLGEHVELHMFSTHLIKGYSIAGYVANNCVEPASIPSRHEQLVREMKRRGYNHSSPISKIVWHVSGARVDRTKSLKELLRRCPECRKRHESQRVR